MSNKNRTLKIKKLMHKMVGLILMQILLLVVFGYIIYTNTPPNSNHIHQTIIKVDEIAYHHSFLNGDMLKVTSDNKTFGFPRYPIRRTTDFSIYELYDFISIGDTIEIMYTEEDGLLGNQYTIVNAISNDVPMRSIEVYDSYLRKQRTIGIVIFAVVEVVYLTFSSLYFIYRGIEYKIFGKKKR